MPVAQARSDQAQARLTPRQGALVALVYAALLFAWVQTISEAPIRGDAQFTLETAINLQHHGAFSMDRSPPRRPTMYREPLPVFATAAGVAAVDAMLEADDAAAYGAGERARLLKMQNLLWATQLCAAAYMTAWYFTSSCALSLLTGVLSYAIFLYPALRPTGIDSLASEIGAAAVLVLGSWWYAVGVSRHSTRALAVAGLAFGALALIKAVALYVFVGLLAALLGLRLWRSRGTRQTHSTVAPARVVRADGGSGALRSTLADAGILLAAFAIVVGPWVCRNWLQFGTPAISERGGLALYHRALFNEVDATEYRGLFYAWAPSPIREPVGRALGFLRTDFERGGRLYRLNARVRAPDNLVAIRAGKPEQTTSIMAEGLAERVKALKAYRAAGYGERAHVPTDDLLRRRAIDKMLDNPVGALRVTLAACWRGALLLLPLLAYALFASWRTGRDELLALCLPSLGFTLFYALFSHFEPRYGATMTPMALTAAAIAAHRAGLFARSHWSRARGNGGATCAPAAAPRRRWPSRSQQRP